jgi:hypothetical protein
MQLKIKPALFYGSAAAAVAGLALGLSLHGPWQSKAGGPQILFSRAEAAEAPAPNDGASLMDAGDTSSAELYDGFLPASPLPVIRLQPNRYPDLFARWHSGLSQASFDDADRVNAEDHREPNLSDDVADDAASANADRTAISAAGLPTHPVPYSQF